jgi:hypothetical protein
MNSQFRTLLMKVSNMAKARVWLQSFFHDPVQ